MQRDEGVRRVRNLSFAACTLMMLAGAACQRDARRPPADPPDAPSAPLGILADEEEAPFAFEGIEDGLAVANLSSDSYAFLDYRGRRVVVLDTIGRVVRIVSREGGAPGELRFPQLLLRTVNGLGVVDGQKNALVTFDTTGRHIGDLPLDTLIAVPAPRLTGMRQLANGAWVYSVIEQEKGERSEALYVRRGREVHLIARTPVATTHAMMTPCRVELPAEPPVFWPTLRWDARDNEVAFVAVAGYRLVVWSGTTGDSTVHSLPTPKVVASEADALELPIGLEVHASGADCTLSRADALRQRGMASERPTVARVVVAPDGAVWARLAVPRDDGITGYRHRGTAVDSVRMAAFPVTFGKDGDFLAIEQSRTASERIVRRR